MEVGTMDSFVDFVPSRTSLIRRLIINASVLLAAGFLILSRTSPALAADNGHGQGKAHDHTSASAVANRHDTAKASNQEHIGGGAGGEGGKGPNG